MQQSNPLALLQNQYQQQYSQFAPQQSNQFAPQPQFSNAGLGSIFGNQGANSFIPGGGITINININHGGRDLYSF